MRNSLRKVYFEIQSHTPLIMHKPTLVDPLSEHKKMMSALTKIKKKNDEHYKEISRLEWEAGLYYDDDLGVYIQSSSLLRSIQDAAKKKKDGKNIKAIIFDHPIGYSIPQVKGKTPQQLWAMGDKYVSYTSVVVQRARVMRTRPLFKDWGCSGHFFIDTEDMSINDSKEYFEKAGYSMGIGDWRPSITCGAYGKFFVKEFKEVSNE